MFSDRRKAVFIAGVAGSFACAAAMAAPVVPPDSALGRAGATAQHVLVSACEGGEQINKRAWQIDALTVTPAEVSIGAKCGQVALKFAGEAKGPGAKGDFVMAGPQNGQPSRMLGVWVYLPANANVDKVGMQLADGEGEYLIMLTPANWTGWKWLEVDLTQPANPALTQAYPQPDKNGRFDQSLRELSVVWYAKAAGPTWVGVDGLVAAVEPDPAAGSGLRVQMSGIAPMEPGQPLAAQLRVTNLSAEPVSATVAFSVQENPTLIQLTAPDPQYGSDHALGAKSWTECEGQRIEEGSLTDGNDTTGAGTAYQTGRFVEAFQFVDLGSERQITHLRNTAGDANWYWKVDISASADGKQYTAVPSLQGLDWHQKWGRNEVPVKEPFKARFLRLRYHNDGKKCDVIRMPVALSVYDGLDDEKSEIPAVGAVVSTGRQQVEIARRSFALVPLTGGATLGPGCYFVAVRVENAGKAQVTYSNLFVMPPAMAKVSADSRFGMNVSDPNLAGMNRRLGVGWVRFENVKWPFVSPSAGVYAYDGSVMPWGVRMDEIIARYRAEGLSILPTMFLTPPYLKSDKAPSADAALSFPPREIEPYGEFTFQTAARYANAKHPAAALKTTDKKSGLGQMSVYELWNEPDLNDMGWGSWRGPFEQYLEMFRFGAEGVKRADPSALVSSGGMGEFKVESIDRLRTYKYKDGKTPLDFTDVLNVHHYTGVLAPELATSDFNVDRSLAAKGNKTYEEELRILSAWRTQHRPGMPIWLTETGYETGGPIALPERTQAAYLVRDLMLALANGVDKVFVFRETGSGTSLWSASGMLRDDGSYKPAWFAYATLIRQLDGVTEGQRQLHPDPNVRIYSWRRGNETLLSAWAIDGEAKIDLKLGACTVTDSFGRSVQTDLNGPVPLSVFPTYISGIGNAAGLEAVYEGSRRLEQAQRDELARLTKLRAYLFDFGSREYVGTVTIGTERLCTPVLADEMWDAGKGYGFEPKPAMSSEVFGGDAAKKDKMDGDAVRMEAGTNFRFRAAPGKYQLRIKAAPLEPMMQFTLKGAKGGDQTLSVQIDKVVEADIEVGAEPLVLVPNKYLLLNWVTLIERK